MMGIRFRKTTLTLVGALLASVGMAGQDRGALPSSQPATTGVPSTPVIASPQLQQRYPRYVIQRQDVLLISFPLSPELNQTVTIQPDGYITLQTAPSIHVQGLTVPELAEAIKQAYAGVLRNPIVNVDLQDFQKPFFTVSGQVGKPGQYELRSDITVAEAIAVAGGLQPTAKTQVFLFHKASDEWYKVEKLNLKDVLNGNNINEDAVIKPGDMVFVPENSITKFRKYVPYSLNAGSYLSQTP
jgi:polysaccharide export outer membrane protein